MIFPLLKCVFIRSRMCCKVTLIFVIKGNYDIPSVMIKTHHRQEFLILQMSDCRSDVSISVKWGYIRLCFCLYTLTFTVPTGFVLLISFSIIHTAKKVSGISLGRFKYNYHNKCVICTEICHTN